MLPNNKKGRYLGCGEQYPKPKIQRPWGALFLASDDNGDDGQNEEQDAQANGKAK